MYDNQLALTGSGIVLLGGLALSQFALFLVAILIVAFAAAGVRIFWRAGKMVNSK